MIYACNVRIINIFVHYFQLKFKHFEAKVSIGRIFSTRLNVHPHSLLYQRASLWRTAYENRYMTHPLFREDRFDLHEWHSDIPSLQSSNTKSESELTYAKEKFKKSTNLTKIVGVPWVKIGDNLSHVVSEFDEKLTTKRNVLSYIASIYNPLGLMSAIHIIGKIIYREEYDKKLSWDTKIPQILK